MKFAKTMAAGLAATAMLASGAAFADYPEKPIKIMVGFFRWRRYRHHGSRLRVLHA